MSAVKIKSTEHLEVSGFSPTCQLFIRPPSQLACLTGKLILDVLVVLARRANPAAAHFTFPYHLIINIDGSKKDVGSCCITCQAMTRDSKHSGSGQHKKVMRHRGMSKSVMCLYHFFVRELQTEFRKQGQLLLHSAPREAGNGAVICKAG